MCPDDALLSALVDEEVPDPWKGRMESHIAECRHCSDKVEALRSLKARLLTIENPAELEALVAAKARISASIDFLSAKATAKPGFMERFRRLWSDRVPMPMPFLAAGILALVFLVGMSLGIFAPLGNSARTMASASKIISPQSATLEMMAQYMKQSSVQPVMIEMPQESVFSQFGNPVIASSPEPVIQEVTSTSSGSLSP